MFPALRGAQVLGLLNGSESAPAKVLEAEDAAGKKKTIPNPDYATWIARDQAVLSYLVNSFSPDILAHVVGLETTEVVWGAITKMFSTQSIAKINHLRGALNTTKKNNLTAA